MQEPQCTSPNAKSMRTRLDLFGGACGAGELPLRWSYCTGSAVRVVACTLRL